ncbi:GPI ethanolamine phosphate transferase 1 [Sitophilus oryzae]|uniref:GPI ethanolamine phosphate transferase 1 n=1 Tax=Sitophilus oryzae TaxID=7048 RepID=A0A6J2YPU4_SITOR|nr:GPI ethanolamine phosphate transferase 1 [Sitophilus oryzae]XP_030764801.1 GPI ethanolamine phosphate transferase 1 [Sitophilus oryzae]
MTNKENSLQIKNKKYQIIILGLLIHFLILFAVFDIYFSSPLDHGMKLVKSISHPPAKRLVLFVADGLRAEAVYGRNTDRIPFLTSIILNNGSWGVAHTRVPTESRPGHVALLAGIYEDPSAIMKGWKANPVYFDSVINQSTNAWCWGSPDILHIFNKDKLDHINLHTYDAKLEDFGDNDTGLLDTWVFERVEAFLLNEVKKCNHNCDKFHQSGNVFFLHLLGIDTAGHGFKPHSKEYIRNIQLVDRNVDRISKLFSEIYNDSLTTFIFTADHGMTDWGSHGAGSPHETEAPLIAWGAGVKANRAQQDVKQIDIAPFLSSLVGLNIPMNSLGVIPLNYLEMSKEDLAEVQLSNTLQLLEIFNVKRRRTEANTLVFIPYKGLTSEVLTEKMYYLSMLKEKKEFDALIKECVKLMGTLIDGLDYYHNYYQYPLLISISVGFIGWILFLIASVLDNEKLGNKSPLLHKRILIIFNAVPVILCYMQSFPLSYYLHFTFPVASFTLLHRDTNRLKSIFFEFKQFLSSDKAASIIIYIIGIELLICGFFHRAAFSILTVLIGLWIFSTDTFGKYTNKRDKLLWISLCSVLSAFPLCPVMKTSFNMPMYVLGCVSWLVLFYEMYCRITVQNQLRNTKVSYKIFHFQFLCLVCAAIYTVLLELGFIANNSSIKYISWFIFVMPISIIPFSNQLVADRLITTFFGFAPFYLLVSSNYEALFSAVYVAILCNWLLIESKVLQATDSGNIIYYLSFNSLIESKQKVNSDMFRRAFLFMVFIFVGFFGTGNIASLNSFDPMWVRAFLTVFSPFKMMGLILLKIAVPFLFTCCVFRAINSIGKENILQMFCIILIFSDIMVLQFLFLITNKGSWLDIGSSLSHFIIMEGFVTILLILYGFAHLLTTVNYLKLEK